MCTREDVHIQGLFLPVLLRSYDGDDPCLFCRADSYAISRVRNGMDCRISLFFRYFKGKRYIGGKDSVCNAYGIRWCQPFYGTYKGVGNGNVYDLVRKIIGDRCGRKAQGHAVAVGPYEAACAKLDAAKIPGDDNYGVGNPVFFSILPASAVRPFPKARRRHWISGWHHQAQSDRRNNCAGHPRILCAGIQ